MPAAVLLSLRRELAPRRRQGNARSRAGALQGRATCARGLLLPGLRERGADVSTASCDRPRAGAGLLAHIMVSKFDDHLPLHREAESYVRSGVELNTSTLSRWVGGATAAALAPLIDTLQRDVMASATLHGDHAPMAVLAPGSGRTKTGRFWAYVRDTRPHRGKRPPAAVFFYSPGRTAEQPLAHLKDFTGVLHADGYAGFKGLDEIGRRPGPIVEAACWAYARRKLHDVHAADGSGIARQSLERIGALDGIEQAIRGQPPDERHRRRQAPTAEDLRRWE